MKYYLLPFGCQMNRSDSERISTVLEQMGYQRAQSEDEDNIVIKGIVACSVRQQAIDRVYGHIRKWNRTKQTSSLITFVSGCILPSDNDKFLKLFDLVFPIDELLLLPSMIEQYGVPLPRSVNLEGQGGIQDFWSVNPNYSSQVEAFVPIQNGCDKFCTYCAVPYTRGREVSRCSQDILREVENLVGDGYKSITLLGQNVNSYGLDRKGRELTFPKLMEKIGQIGERGGRKFWVYFTSPHPWDMTAELLNVIASYPVLASWLHLPLQSGDDDILKKMNRNYTLEHYRSIVKDKNRILPQSNLFTDIIVGFSGETEEQFQTTRNAMIEFQYDMAYIARYSPRPGAKSAHWDDDISHQEKTRRYTILNETLVEICRAKSRQRLGQIYRVLVTSIDRHGYPSGYTEGRIPVRIKNQDVSVGNFVDVKISSVRPLSMEGEVIAQCLM